MNILGIESSCDETAAAVVRDGVEVLSSTVASQVELHAGYGGVIPELAARQHVRAIDPIVREALAAAGCEASAIDAVAVTCCPGLVPALIVGVSYAEGLAAALDRPLLGINHFLAHIYGAVLEDPDWFQAPEHYPLLALVVSGGHTALLLVDASGRTRMVGRTLDDAAGEAFDKAAKILHLGYPGGPIIDRLAASGNPAAFRFPRGLLGGGGRPVRPADRFNFSFSGLKTALLYHVRDRGGPEDIPMDEVADIAASYQRAVVEVLVRKTVDAAAATGARTVILCGGVACNRELRTTLAEAFRRRGSVRLLAAPPRYCTDNAVMVAGLGFHESQRLPAGGYAGGVRVLARLPDPPGRAEFAPRAH